VPGGSAGSGSQAAPPEARERFADAVRRVLEVLPRSVATTEAFLRATELVEQARELVAAGAPEWRPEFEPPEDGARAPGEMAEWYFPYSPVIGPLNPVSPPITFHYRDGMVHGVARFTSQYQGPPGCVHGGVIAQFFDELLGAANVVAGNGAMTGKLTVRYRSTTPLYTDLRFEARSHPPNGRKVHAEGFLWAGDRLTAQAEGVFVMVDRERFMEITVGSHAKGPDLPGGNVAGEIRKEASMTAPAAASIPPSGVA